MFWHALDYFAFSLVSNESSCLEVRSTTISLVIAHRTQENTLYTFTGLLQRILPRNKQNKRYERDNDVEGVIMELPWVHEHFFSMEILLTIGD